MRRSGLRRRADDHAPLPTSAPRRRFLRSRPVRGLRTRRRSPEAGRAAFTVYQPDRPHRLLAAMDSAMVGPLVRRWTGIVSGGCPRGCGLYGVHASLRAVGRPCGRTKYACPCGPLHTRALPMPTRRSTESSEARSHAAGHRPRALAISDTRPRQLRGGPSLSIGSRLCFTLPPEEPVSEL